MFRALVRGSCLALALACRLSAAHLQACVPLASSCPCSWFLPCSCSRMSLERLQACFVPCSCSRMSLERRPALVSCACSWFLPSSCSRMSPSAARLQACVPLASLCPCSWILLSPCSRMLLERRPLAGLCSSGIFVPLFHVLALPFALACRLSAARLQACVFHWRFIRPKVFGSCHTWLGIPPLSHVASALDVLCFT